MRVAKRNDDFARCYNERYLPDDAPEEEGEKYDKEWSEQLPERDG